MLRIVPHTVPRVGRSYKHFPDGFELYLLTFIRHRSAQRVSLIQGPCSGKLGKFQKTSKYSLVKITFHEKGAGGDLTRSLVGIPLTSVLNICISSEVSRGEKAALRGTDPESYDTEYT